MSNWYEREPWKPYKVIDLDIQLVTTQRVVASFIDKNDIIFFVYNKNSNQNNMLKVDAPKHSSTIY